MIKKLRTPIIILLLSSPLIFIDLYTKYLSHQNITSEDKEMVITQNIAITVPLKNKGWGLQDPNTVTKLTTITKNIVLSAFSIFFLLGALEGSPFYEKILLNILRAGIFSNTLDALFLDGVTDFIFLKNYEVVTNFADLYLFFGGGAFILLQIIPALYIIIRNKII